MTQDGPVIRGRAQVSPTLEHSRSISSTGHCDSSSLSRLPTGAQLSGADVRLAGLQMFIPQTLEVTVSKACAQELPAVLFCAHTKFSGPLITPNKPSCLGAAIRCHFSCQMHLIHVTGSWNCTCSWPEGPRCFILEGGLGWSVLRRALNVIGNISVWRNVEPSGLLKF